MQHATSLMNFGMASAETKDYLIMQIGEIFGPHGKPLSPRSL
jgi:hypothetical protein